MTDYSKNAKRRDEDINDENFSDGMSNESRELFKRALTEALDSKIRRNEEEIKGMEIPPTSKRHKIRMNRLFRERVGGSFLPFLEEDNLCERVRGSLVIKFKINEFFDRREERKRAR